MLLSWLLYIRRAISNSVAFEWLQNRIGWKRFSTDLYSCFVKCAWICEMALLKSLCSILLPWYYVLLMWCGTCTVCCMPRKIHQRMIKAWLFWLNDVCVTISEIKCTRRYTLHTGSSKSVIRIVHIRKFLFWECMKAMDVSLLYIVRVRHCIP